MIMKKLFSNCCYARPAEEGSHDNSGTGAGDLSPAAPQLPPAAPGNPPVAAEPAPGGRIGVDTPGGGLTTPRTYDPDPAR